MWCEQLDNGKIKYIERYIDPLTLKNKRVSITLTGKDTAANRKIAFEELQRKMDEACSDTKITNITMSELVSRYISYQKLTVKMSTWTRNEGCLKRLSSILGEDSIVDNLTVHYVKSKLLEHDYTPGAMNEYIKRFKAMLNWGYDNDLTTNYQLIRKLKLFKDDRYDRIKDKYLEPDELSILLSRMENTKLYHWYYLTEFLVLSGLRIGEAAALTQNDINGELIYVTKNYDLNNGIVTTPKTSKSNRTVYIQPELAQMLKKYRLWSNENQMSKGFRTDKLFYNSSGGFISYASYAKYLREVSESTLGRRITPHTLRHTHASLLLANGVSIDSITRRLGHESSKITKEIYLHVTKQLQESDNEQIKRARIL